MKFKKCDFTNSCVFGDVHSSLENLKNILVLLDTDNRKKVISVGDIWDRGTEPNEVVDIIYDLFTKGNFIPLVGNHESKFIRYLTDSKTVSMGSQQTATLSLLTDDSKRKFLEIYAEEIVCAYDPLMKIFITHGPGGRPHRILYKNYEAYRVVIGGQASISFEDFLILESHNVAKKHIATLLYGITNGDKNSEGFPIRQPIAKSNTDDLEGWRYIYGHIHSNAFHPDGNTNLICLDFCSPIGKVGGCIITSHNDIKLVV